MTLIPSASQTVGPFFNFGLTANPSLGILVKDGVEGERIKLSFRVLDGDNAPTPGDSMIELWQADARGHCAPQCLFRAAAVAPRLPFDFDRLLRADLAPGRVHPRHQEIGRAHV